MNDQDYIKEGVELADGWWRYGGWGATVLQKRSNKKYKDALAAQMIRQANAIAGWDKYGHYGDPMEPIMNIIDDKVLLGS